MIKINKGGNDEREDGLFAGAMFSFNHQLFIADLWMTRPLWMKP